MLNSLFRLLELAHKTNVIKKNDRILISSTVVFLRNFENILLTKEGIYYKIL